MKALLNSNKLFLLITSLFFCTHIHEIYAQKNDKALNSPYSALHTHFHYLQSDSYNIKKAILPFKYAGNDTEKEKLAIYLKLFFDVKYIFLYEEDWPKNKNYIDSVSNEQKYILFEKYPQVYLSKVKDDWVYSKETINAIPGLIKTAYPFGLHKLLLVFPIDGDTIFFNLSTWQLAGLAIFFVVSLCLFFLIRLFTRRLLLNSLARYGIDDKKRVLIRNIATPLALSLLFYGLTLFLPLLRIPYSKLYGFFAVVIQLIPIYYVTMALIRLSDVLLVILTKLAAKTESKMDDQLVPIFVKLIKVIIYMGAFIFVLLIFKIDLMPVLAGLSLGGLALALAAQDTLKNVFASVMIFLDKPFQIGDVVISGEIAGTIEEVGIRSSLIRTFTNSLQYVPNNILANAVIDNLGKREYRRFRTMISITYGTPTYKIDMFVLGINKIILSMECSNKDSFQVYLHEFAASSLDIILNAHFKVVTWDAELKARHYLIKKILELAETIGIDMAFPTQTLHIEKSDEGKKVDKDLNTEKEQLNKRMDDWLRENT